MASPPEYELPDAEGLGTLPGSLPDTAPELSVRAATDEAANTVIDLPEVPVDLGAIAPAEPAGALTVHAHTGRDLARHLPRLEAYVAKEGPAPLSRHPAWGLILQRGLRHVPYCLEAVADGRTRGLLALAYVRSLLFGRFLVSLPYLNYGGVQADDPSVARPLIDRAVALADELKVRYLELRHEAAVDHPRLLHKASAKVNVHLALPESLEELWDRLSCKVRNQVRKAEKQALTVAWGGPELLREFYQVFSHNMRDLGTPVYSRRLFAATVEQFPQRAEFCCVRQGTQPLAAALLLHGWGVTEVPSASSLRAYNGTCANMLLYWHLLQRAIQRGQQIFDFGRCSPDGNTFRFKRQWGAQPSYTAWQFYLRHGTIGELNPYNPRFQRHVRRWQRLPVWLTRILGPGIVRGIP
jgi:FemAB-related protein (PEP-CTERM system-associated)